MHSLSHNRLAWCYALLLASVLVVYFNSYDAGFVGDDYAVIVNNAKNLDDPSKITTYFTKGVWDHTNVGAQDHNLYRPTWLVWNFIVYQLAGEQPLLWHLSSLLLHVINGILLFHLAGLLLPASSPSSRFLTALIFLVYPAASHDVINITFSTDLLLAPFFLISLIAYLNFRKGRGGLWYVVSMLAFAGALLTKETGMCLLLLLLLLDWDQETLRQKIPWREYAGFALLAAGYLLIRSTVLQKVTGAGDAWQLDFAGLSRLLEYGATYLRTLFLPWPLPTTLRHPPQGVGEVFAPYLGVMIFLALGYLFVRFRNSRISIGLILLPISIPLLLALHNYGLFAVRFLYLPAAGMALLLLPVIDRGLHSKLWRTITILYLLCLATLTVAETYNWKDGARWGSNLVKYDPTNNAGWLTQARYYKNHGMPDKAITTYRQALDNVTDKKDWVTLAENLGVLLAEERRYEESLSLYTEITTMAGFEHLGWTGVGNNLWMLGRLEEAAGAYQRALTTQPEYFDALYNYGLVNAKMGNLDVAISTFEHLVKTPIKADRLKQRQQVKNQLFLWQTHRRQMAQ